MSDVKPILFSGPMVRALLEGRKTMTRRVLKPQPIEQPGMNCRNLLWLNKRGEPRGISSPEGDTSWVFTPYAPGQLLWVRETWAAPHTHDHLPPRLISAGTRFHYSATGERGGLLWRPSIHMPRWASRLTLEVTAVKVERLQEISQEDARAEGVATEEWEDWRENVTSIAMPEGAYIENERDLFRDLWDGINASRGLCADDAPRGWQANPWVTAISFRVHKMNVDAFLAQREAA